MKFVRRSEIRKCWVQGRFFGIVMQGGRKRRLYTYWISWFIDGEDHDHHLKLYQSNKRSWFLNKYTLNFLGVVFPFFWYLNLFILYPFRLYFYGCKNFIKNTGWQQNVREFNWMNFIGVIICLVYIIVSRIS